MGDASKVIMGIASGGGSAFLESQRGDPPRALTKAEIDKQQRDDRAKGERAIRDKNRLRVGRRQSIFAGANAVQGQIGKIQVGTKLG